MTAATLALTAERWTPFKDTLECQGLDLTGGTFALQIRSYRDAPGDPLVSLTNQTAGTQGLSVVVSTVDDMPVSVITIQINETTIEGLLPFAVTSGVANRKAATVTDPTASDVKLAYDLHVTATGIPKQRFVEGTFTIKAGATV